MSTARQLHYTYEDYLRLSSTSPTKFEFLDGEIYAMAGGTPEHAALAGQVTVLLGSRLPVGCRIFSSDLRVLVEATGLATFPDISVVCGDHQTSARDANAVTNPTVLVEVTSPSTEDYDRGEKLSHYKQLPSVQTVLLVSHRRRQVTVVNRTASGWIHREARPGETFDVKGLGLALSADEVYGTLVP